jgi:protein-S-isoprenylcysteine O-methyltransferase Ste14
VSIPTLTRLTTGLDLQSLQRQRKRVLVAGIVVWLALLAVTDSIWYDDWPRTHRTIRSSGLMLIFACILGRTWATLYIGGLKARVLITKGPYSVVRNPLYLFTLLGAAGVGALSGSLTMAVVCTGFAAIVFLSVVRKEEQFLLATFPREFSDYVARVPRLLPRLSVWKDADQLIVQPRFVRRTFLEASLFLMAVPLVDLKALMQDLQWLPSAVPPVIAQCTMRGQMFASHRRPRPLGPEALISPPLSDVPGATRGSHFAASN